jgi:ElaB/YqjD/DUF883 family membrane-anchored ribosome-binding protein
MTNEPEGQAHGGDIRGLQKVVVPIRNGLSEAAESLSHALTRASTAVEEIRSMSPRAFMARSPLIALVVAAGIGFLLGLSRSRRT